MQAKTTQAFRTYENQISLPEVIVITHTISIILTASESATPALGIYHKEKEDITEISYIHIHNKPLTRTSKFKLFLTMLLTFSQTPQSLQPGHIF